MIENKLSIGVAGASGATGGEICRLLLGHPAVGEILPASRGETAFEQSHPNLLGCGLSYVSPDALMARAKTLDAVFLCTPSGEAMQTAQGFLEGGAKVIDLGPDFRFPDPGLYQLVYDRPHVSPELLTEAVYGVTELNRDAIAGARLVANPGCYAITTILATTPAIVHDLIDPDSAIHVCAVNGTSGAGGDPKRDTSHAAAFAGMLPYSMQGHRHGPELEYYLGQTAGRQLEVVLSTAHGNFVRGIQATISIKAHPRIASSLSRDILTRIWTDFYGEGTEKEAFVVINNFGRIGKKNAKEYHLYPNVARLAGANHCQIGLDYDPDRSQIKIVAATDNLVKGAAGSAIQNMNLMLGLSEDTGLRAFGL